ncbi:MAG: hypothetical protein WKF57_10965 [Nakamurella sp.]
MFDWLLDAVEAFVDSPWLLLVVFAVLLGGAFLPGLPGATTLLAAIAAVADDPGRVASVAGSALAGAIIGDAVGHRIGRRWGTRVLAARWLRRTRRPVLRARNAMRAHPMVVLVGGRFLPAGRLAGVLAAGISLVSLGRMLRITVPVAIGWTGWMTFLGVLGGRLAGQHALAGPAAAWIISSIITTVVVCGTAVIARRRHLRTRSSAAGSGVGIGIAAGRT